MSEPAIARALQVVIVVIALAWGVPYAVLQLAGRGHGAELPPGLVSPMVAIELARSPAEIADILADAALRQRMRLENTLDFVFIAGYWLLFSGLGLLLARHRRLVPSPRGRAVLAFAAVACATGAAAFDVLENVRIYALLDTPLAAAELPARVDAVRGASLVKWSFVFGASALAGLAFVRRGRAAATFTGAAFLAGAALGSIGLTSDGSRFLVEWAMYVLAGAVASALWGLSPVARRRPG